MCVTLLTSIPLRFLSCHSPFPMSYEHPVSLSFSFSVPGFVLFFGSSLLDLLSSSFSARFLKFETVLERRCLSYGRPSYKKPKGGLHFSPIVMRDVAPSFCRLRQRALSGKGFFLDSGTTSPPDSNGFLLFYVYFRKSFSWPFRKLATPIFQFVA